MLTNWRCSQSGVASELHLPSPVRVVCWCSLEVPAPRVWPDPSVPELPLVQNEGGCWSRTFWTESLGRWNELVREKWWWWCLASKGDHLSLAAATSTVEERQRQGGSPLWSCRWRPAFLMTRPESTAGPQLSLELAGYGCSLGRLSF